jgi:hypothetical protein
LNIRGEMRKISFSSFPPKSVLISWLKKDGGVKIKSSLIPWIRDSHNKKSKLLKHY